MGKTPTIHVWDEKMRSLACLRGTHTKAVSQLCHSTDGKFLFSVGLEYSVAIHCIDQQNKLFGQVILRLYLKMPLHSNNSNRLTVKVTPKS
jgi:hypothetical protein